MQKYSVTSKGTAFKILPKSKYESFVIVIDVCNQNVQRYISVMLENEQKSAAVML